MECKDDKHWLCSALIQVLIETLWNVKSHGLAEISSLSASFNRNIVECKEESAEKAAESKEAF